ncbi:hypothetical protein HDU67_010280, partial [Dinochytrium kinnereticum]
MALTNTDPKDSDFTESFTPSASAFLANTGPFEIPVDASATATVGANATLRIAYEAGDGLLFQCVDV